MNKLSALFILFLIFISSCIPREKIVYLQGPSEEDYKAGDVIDGFEVRDFQYRLKSEDIISIKVASLTETEFNFFRESENQMNVGNPLLSGYVINSEGFIELPYVDKVMVTGLTLNEAEEKIKDALTGYLNSPTVFVKLLSFQYSVLGEVNVPNRYTSYTNKINLLEALGTAGDLTDFADRSKIKIVRFENDIASIFFVNVLDDNVMSSPYFYLQPGDIIIVPPLKLKTTLEYGVANFTLGLSALGAIFLIYRTIDQVNR